MPLCALAQTLMLLDVVNVVAKLASLVKAILSNGLELSLVFYLMIITALIYSSFGLEHFTSAFTTEALDGSEVQFESVLSAFWFLLYNTPAKGNYKGFLGPAEPKGSEWLTRILFDTIGFLWVGVILFTSITALLVDALGKTRTSREAKSKAAHTTCFMCGEKRDNYDDAGLPVGSPSFREHCMVDHDPWTVIGFLSYLQYRPGNQDTSVLLLLIPLSAYQGIKH